MNDAQLQTIEQILAFLAGSEAIAFSVEEPQERYVFIVSILVRFGYWKRSMAEKGLLRRYLGKIIGYSRAQITRLIADYGTRGRLGRRQWPRARFVKRYTALYRRRCSACYTLFLDRCRS